MIKLLAKRGSQLKKSAFEEARKVEQKIHECKENHYDELVTPVHTFVIFEHEIARLTALKKCFRKAFHFDGMPLEMLPTAHPTTVSWQNIQVK